MSNNGLNKKLNNIKKKIEIIQIKIIYYKKIMMNLLH